jgi:ribosomal protein S18 acetylase RimI-like enzyme
MIRKATLNDAGAIAQVHVESWHETYSELIPAEVLEAMTDYERRLQMWSRVLSNESHSSFVALNEAEEILGFVNGGRPNGEAPEDYDAELYTIYLLRCQHGKGLGRKLMAALAKDLHEKGFKALYLWVFPNNPSRHFYKRLGGIALLDKSFEMVGETLSERAYGWPDVRSLLPNEEYKHDIASQS